MPTGYTAAVVDGTVTDFRTFALRCARAFGACILQRDEPMDALPRIDPPSTWHAERAEKARTRLVELEAMTPEQIDAAAAEQHARDVAAYEDSRRRADEARNRCNDMLRAVVKWEPPTKDHAQMRAFMIEQLTQTRDMDGRSYAERPVEPFGAAWHLAAVQQAKDDIVYCEAEQLRENERHAQRQAWLDALTASLDGVAV